MFENATKLEELSIRASQINDLMTILLQGLFNEYQEDDSEERIRVYFVYKSLKTYDALVRTIMDNVKNLEKDILEMSDEFYNIARSIKEAGVV